MVESRDTSVDVIGHVDAASGAVAAPNQSVYGVTYHVGARGKRRFWGLVLAAVAGTILGLAVWMSPDPDGYGTHAQLGLPPCTWMIALKVPCPTCGMTTSFSHAVQGELGEAFLVQPLGAILAIFTAVVFLLGVYVALTGSRVANRLAGPFRVRWLWTFSVVVVLAWGYKILVVTAGGQS